MRHASFFVVAGSNRVTGIVEHDSQKEAEARARSRPELQGAWGYVEGPDDRGGDAVVILGRAWR